MYEVVDWDKIYYAIIKHYNNGKIELMSTGSTLQIVKNDCLKQELTLNLHIGDEMERAIVNCGLFKPAYIHSVMNTSYEVVYCEAKVHIYAKRYGIDGMVITPDPTYYQDLYRYVGYDKVLQRSHKKRKDKVDTFFEKG